eukprot:1350343-Rhodomonas_salina.1
MESCCLSPLLSLLFFLLFSFSPFASPLLPHDDARLVAVASLSALDIAARLWRTKGKMRPAILPLKCSQILTEASLMSVPDLASSAKLK